MRVSDTWKERHDELLKLLEQDDVREHFYLSLLDHIEAHGLSFAERHFVESLANDARDEAIRLRIKEAPPHCPGGSGCTCASVAAHEDDLCFQYIEKTFEATRIAGKELRELHSQERLAEDAEIGGLVEGLLEESPVYTVECFTPLSVPQGAEWNEDHLPTQHQEKGFKTGLGFAENAYDCETPAEVADCVSNCSRKVAGIRMLRVWVNKTHDRDPVETEPKGCGGHCHCHKSPETKEGGQDE